MLPLLALPSGAQRPTLAKRLRSLADGDDAALARWKAALKWAKERAADHVVHVTMPDGREREKKLFEEYSIDDARDYDDETLRNMLDWFDLARVQYASFL